MPAILALVGCIGLDSIPSREKPEGDETSGTTVGALQLDAVAIDFGTVLVGDTADEALALTNTGDAPLHVEAALTGPGAFTLATTALDVDGTAAITVSFSPRTPEAYAGALVLTVDDTDTIEVPLTGTGTDDAGGTTTTPPEGGPDIDVTPARYDFGLVDLGATEVTTFTVTNAGDEDLLVSDVRVDDAAFTVAGALNPPQVLEPGESKDVEVTFEPSTDTTYSASLVVESDDADTPSFAVALSGEGVDRCDVCTPIIDVDTGSDPNAIGDFFSFLGSTDTREIIVRNLGDVDLVIDEVEVNNDFIATCGEFAVGDWSGRVTLGAGESTLFTISYTADGTCVDAPVEELNSNVAHIRSNDPVNDDWVISLTGAGLG